MQSDDWLKTTVIGGVLIFLGFLLVPLFIAYGYIGRAIRTSLSGDPEPPTFEDWGELLVDGLQIWLIGLLYLLVPLIVAALTVGGALVAIATGSEVGAATGAGSLFFGLLVTTILSLAFGYLAVVAIVNFARENRFGAAFDFGVIRTVALDREYALAWLFSVAVFVVASFVGAIPLLGWILAPFASFYAAMVAANLWAGGFSRALEPTAGINRPQDDAAV